MRKLLLPMIAALVAGTLAALAANTTFFTSTGDLVFPFSPPTTAGAAGTIDNMTIGATTPRAGTLTTLSTTGLATLASATVTGTLTATGGIATTGGVGPAGGFANSARLVMSGNWKPLAITDGVEVTCVATTTYVAEVFVPANMTVTGVALVNATAVAGNVQVGLATSAGAPIAAALSASTAASGTAAYQRIPFAVAYAAKGPATYYIQLQCNNTGYKFRAHTVGDFSTQSQTSGVFGTFASFSPAGTFTTAVGPIASFY